MRNGWRIVCGLSVTACSGTALLGALLISAACGAGTFGASDDVVPWHEMGPGLPAGRYLEMQEPGGDGTGTPGGTSGQAENIAYTDKEPEGLWSLGEFTLTAYCSCEACCGYWATVRPLDEEGNPIVYTADGSVARQGVTVAADTDILPFGTVLVIDGREYIVQDRGGKVKGKHIDVYFDNHEDAREFGVKVMEIFKKEET